MNIQHDGAKDCVTGSCHLVQTQVGVNILVDCGKAYGNDPELPFDEFPVSPRDIDYLFLTHAHIDHIGRVPDLIDAGFQGEIICTHATKALLIPMLHDALSFTDKSGKELRRLEKAIDELSWGFEYNEVFSLKKGDKGQAWQCRPYPGFMLYRVQLSPKSSRKVSRYVFRGSGMHGQAHPA